MKNEAEITLTKEMKLEGKNYKLIGIVNHRGSRYSGHYTADIKSKESWFQCNDSKVERRRLPIQICSKDVYVLFYSV